ncbi:MAG: tetratricopeptide repeat protein [Flavobacteriales bacterium]|nr:tetratricopeptide repeat protein [Flavobacteriales bacterium]
MEKLSVFSIRHAFAYPQKKQDKASKKILKKTLAESLNNIGFIYDEQGNTQQALTYYLKSLDLAQKIGEIDLKASTLNNSGSVYVKIGEIGKGLDLYHKSLKIREQQKDNKGVAQSLVNVGAVYRGQGDWAQAKKYYLRSLKISEQIGNKNVIALCLNNIGYISYLSEDFEEGMDYFKRSLKIREELGDKKNIANSCSNMANIFFKQNKLEKALEMNIRSLKISQEIKNRNGVSESLSKIGAIYLKQNRLNLALDYGVKSMGIANELGFPKMIKSSSILLSKIYEKQGKGMKALEMYKLYIQMKDSVNNESTQKATAKQQAKYEYEKQKVIDDAEHDKQLAIEQEEKGKQQILTYSTGGGLALVIVFLIFVFNRLRVTKKQKLVIEEQKIEVEQQKEVVEEAHSELEEKNQEIMDSIIYAKRIQSAILPPAKVVKKYLKESFILYKPKDVVAGDFYWMESVAPTGNKKEIKVLFAAADCTGHGVPGAMVSVVCNNALNRSVREHGLTDPGEILTKTRDIVIAEFEKSEEDVKDGMDIALCSLEGMKLQYAGAHNPLWIIRKGEILETKANKQPIGQFDHPEPYITHSFDLEKGDSIYIFSDGYVDQFGGEKGKKFKSNAFRELLLSIQDKAMEDQKTIIDDTFETWKGSLEQIDDVCVIGVRI